MKALKVVGGVIVVLVVIAVVAYALTWRGKIDEVARPDPAAIDPGLVEAGARLAAAGNCIACHTVPGGEAFAGGLGVPTPFGTIYSTNITPDEETGIGNWSLAAFARALRQGVDREGHHLYPAFPYDHYTLVSDDDTAALYAYLMTRQPVENAARDNDLTFPLGFRPLVAGWKLLYFDEGRFVPSRQQSPAWNRGAYLAEGLAHCGACHTPRNALGARKADAHWAGGASEGWTAYPINSASPAPIPWDAKGVAFYLRHGWHAEHGVSRGPMAEVTGNLGRLSDQDIAALGVYTASVMGEPDAARQSAAEALREEIATGRGAGQAADTMTLPAAAGGRRSARGRDLCHGLRHLPRERASAALWRARLPALHGGACGQPAEYRQRHAVRPSPRRRQASAVMPAFRGVLSDADMVALLTYMRGRYTDLPDWGGLDEMVSDTRSGAHEVSIRPTDGIERGPGNLGAEEQPWRQN